MATYFPDAPDVLGQDQAAIQQGLAQAMTASTVDQAEAHTFFVTSGAAASPGHADVNSPGRQGDGDAGLSDAADL